jgi:peptidoglycan/LPS O-acetylase OafA/YrhL
MLLPRVSLSQRVCDAISRPPLRWLAIAVPVSLVVYFSPEAIFDFRNGFIPRLDFLAYHLPFFAMGAVLFRTRRELSRSIRFWWLELVAAGALVPALHILIGRRESAIEHSALLSGVVGGFGALVSTALIGWSASPLAPRSAGWRWLAHRSFFIYFWHLPFVGLAHIGLYRLTVPTPIKMLLAFSAGMLGATLVCSVLHGTRVGRWLGDRDAPLLHK